MIAKTSNLTPSKVSQEEPTEAAQYNRDKEPLCLNSGDATSVLCDLGRSLYRLPHDSLSISSSLLIISHEHQMGGGSEGNVDPALEGDM